jgi:hypothetical protein
MNVSAAAEEHALVWKRKTDMNHVPVPSHDDEQAVVREMIGRFDSPAFIRRSRRVEEGYRLLLERLQQQRTENLQMVRLRLGQLHALCGEWSALESLLSNDYLQFLKSLHDELQPQLRLPILPTKSSRELRGALEELREAILLFNGRWQKVLDQLDLAPLNGDRAGYNRHYLLEKECALGSSRVARERFEPLLPIASEHIAGLFPLLPVPSRTLT